MSIRDYTVNIQMDDGTTIPHPVSASTAAEALAATRRAVAYHFGPAHRVVSYTVHGEDTSTAMTMTDLDSALIH